MNKNLFYFTYFCKLDPSAFSSMEQFIKDLAITRNRIINPATIEVTFGNLKDLKDTIIAYLNILSYVKSKINFGTDQFSLKIEFIWKDTVKDSFTSSYNVAFEFYSVLYNLAVCNNMMTKLINADSDEEVKLKDAIKTLEFSAGIMEKIKTELPTFMADKEIPNDLSGVYLTFVIFFANVSLLMNFLIFTFLI